VFILYSLWMRYESSVTRYEAGTIPPSYRSWYWSQTGLRLRFMVKCYLHRMQYEYSTRLVRHHFQPVAGTGAIQGSGCDSHFSCAHSVYSVYTHTVSVSAYTVVISCPHKTALSMNASSQTRKHCARTRSSHSLDYIRTPCTFMPTAASSLAS
jgi:hypothetical protein